MAETKKKSSINYQYFLHTRKYLVIAIGLSVASVFVTMTILLPNFNKVRTLLSTVNTEKRKLANLQRKSDTLQNVQSTDLYSKRESINAILPSSKPLLQLLNQIDKVSKENQVIVSEFGVVPGEISTPSAEFKETTPPKPKGQNPNLDILETKLNIIGRIDNINSFLRSINTLTPLTETTELSLRGINRQDLVDQNLMTDSSVFEATLTLTSYFFVGDVQTDPTRDLPDLNRFTTEETAQLDEFQIPVSSLVPVDFNVEGGGKENLFQ
jgi:hypothetical protein